VKFAILAYGSRGDVQPYIALSLGLQAAGHSVRLAAPAMFRGFVEQYGLEFYELPGDPAQFLKRAFKRPGYWLESVRTARALVASMAPVAGKLAGEILIACRGCDAVIHSLVTSFLGHHAAQVLDIPDLSALVFAVFAPTHSFPNPLFPPLHGPERYNIETHLQFTRVFFKAQALTYNWLRSRRPYLPPLQTAPFEQDGAPPILFGFSQAVLPRPSDWGAHVHQTGYWFLPHPAGWQPAPELADFLAAGEPPVYFGVGSVIARDTARLTRPALRVLAMTGQRGVFLTGPGGMDASILKREAPGRALGIRDVPFDWLFPRVAAAVHHSGMGTCADALRAGLPCVLAPFGADQPFWARVLVQNGLAAGQIAPHRFDENCLADRIHVAMEDTDLHARLCRVKEQLAAEDGVGRAVRLIEAYTCSRTGVYTNP